MTLATCSLSVGWTAALVARAEAELEKLKGIAAEIRTDFPDALVEARKL